MSHIIERYISYRERERKNSRRERKKGEKERKEGGKERRESVRDVTFYDMKHCYAYWCAEVKK